MIPGPGRRRGLRKTLLAVGGFQRRPRDHRTMQAHICQLAGAERCKFAQRLPIDLAALARLGKARNEGSDPGGPTMFDAADIMCESH